MWEFGGLDQDGNIDNPWKGASKMAPFDQEVNLATRVAMIRHHAFILKPTAKWSPYILC